MSSKDDIIREMDEFGEPVRGDRDLYLLTPEIIDIYKQQLHSIQVFMTNVEAYDSVELLQLPESYVTANDYGDAITATIGFPGNALNYVNAKFGTSVNTAWLVGRDLLNISIERGADSLHVITDEDSGVDHNSKVTVLSLNYHFAEYARQHNEQKEILLTGAELSAEQQKKLAIIQRIKKSGDGPRPDMPKSAG
jgi:hypothetical protein